MAAGPKRGGRSTLPAPAGYNGTVFTGIITHTGIVRTRSSAGSGAVLAIAIPGRPDLRAGGSVAVDGVCLTATSIRGEEVSFDVVRETLERTTLGDVREGDRVNVEFPLRAGDPIGGHFVQGHVDGVGEIVEVSGGERDVRMRIRVPVSLAPEIAFKGSVAVDGVSLTVAGVEGAEFTVALIPETLARTALGRKRPGARVNIETDVLAKYVRRILEGQRC
jgi:riboflavin synthase alpha subunit